MRAIKAPDFGYNLKSKKDSMKRGEKEAISLLRRRRLKFAVKMMSILASGFIILSSVYLWRTGQISLWIAEAESVMGARMIDAGLVFEEVRIKGQTRTKTDEIKNIFYEKYGQPLLDIDIKQVKNNVEQLTWVKNAMVTRKLPGALEINIIEYYPSALWQMDNKLWVIADDGTIITDQGLEEFTELPMISGAGADKAIENLIRIVSNNMTLFSQVATASWIGERRWDLMLDSGIKIMLPETGIEDAWARLLTLEETEQLLARNILVVDLRIKEKTIVRLTPQEALRRRLLAKTSGTGEEI